ncbi:uncharacterized protein LOC124283176 [Haliotis rubra]|uniref:uncharacterized protein LOC124283176 n=1 Tax=Haliotis rubra TaxID=36100 RepID=UPI001EE4F069|nr:uncharacterized protein LOC124283176 [Haliotis rubra]
MKMLLLVFVLALMTFACVTAYPPKDKDRSRVLLETLAPVYARYVVCYSCGSRYNKSKSDCDDDVRKLAVQACTRFPCTFPLNDRLERLRKFLTLRYQTEARRWCGADWVKKYI